MSQSHVYCNAPLSPRALWRLTFQLGQLLKVCQFLKVWYILIADEIELSPSFLYHLYLYFLIFVLIGANEIDSSASSSPSFASFHLTVLSINYQTHHGTLCKPSCYSFGRFGWLSRTTPYSEWLLLLLLSLQSMRTVSSSAGLSKMVNTPDLILHGKLRMDNLIPLKGITLRKIEVCYIIFHSFFSWCDRIPWSKLEGYCLWSPIYRVYQYHCWNLACCCW